MTKAALKKLVNERGQVKSKLTRLKTFFENPISQNNIEELQLRFEKLEKIWSDFEVIQEQIEILDETTDHSVEKEELKHSTSIYFPELKNT